MSKINKFTHALANAHLKTKLTIMTMSVCAITAFFLCVAFVINDILNIQERLVKEVSLVGKIIGERTVSRIVFDQPEKAALDLKALEFKSSVKRACIYKNDGELFAEYISSSNNSPCPTHPDLGVFFSISYLILHQEITSPGRPSVGSIYIVSDLREIYARIKRSLLTVLVIITFVMSLAYFLAEKLQKMISSPIFNLVDATRSVAQKGNYSVRVTKCYDDEIGELTDSFNKMMKEIQDASTNLERKVQKRTRALEREKIKAESANKAKSEFLRNMSHEFRTPLHAMNSFSIYGLKEAETASRKDLYKYFSRIQNGTIRLLKLVDGVLSLARLESGQEAFSMEQGNLYSAVDSVVKEEQALLQDKKISLDFAPPTCSTEAVFDNDKMVQVITNIMSNAIKFTPEGKKISIKFDEIFIENKKEKNPAIALSIIDEGVGVPENELESIFDKFVQSSRTNTGAGGTGLGLSIAMNIVRGHEGLITVENNENYGTTFKIIIPKNLPEGQKIVDMVQQKDKEFV